MDTRNVADPFKNVDDEEIRAALDATRLLLHVATMNVQGDFHKGNILRTSEGFNIEAFHIVGMKKWDRRSAVGAHNRLLPQHSLTIEEMWSKVPQGYRKVACDNIEGSVSIYDYEFDPNTVMIFGEEGTGLDQETLNACDDLVQIPIRGAVRSFSVSTAAGIMIYEYVRQTA